MASNSTTTTNNTGADMESVIISGVRYEVPKAVADLLKSSKSSSDSNSQITIYNPRTTRFVEYCAGVGSIGEEEKIDASMFVGAVEIDNVIEEVTNREEGCVYGVGPVEEEEDDIIFVEAVSNVVKNPEGVNVAKNNQEGVVDTDDTNFLFACSEEKEDTEKDAGEHSVGTDLYGVNQILEELVEMGKIAELKRNEVSEDIDCEVVETSTTVSKKKMKKSLPLRIQPLREGGKRKLVVKEEPTLKSSVKRAKRSKSGKEILMEVECSEKFLLDEGLTEVYELLKAQGWEKVCDTQEFVCPEVVEEFYKNMKLIDGTVPALEVKFRGDKFTLSSIELAMIMGLNHKGFDLYCKNNQWPKEAGEKQDFVKRICNLEKVPKGSGISTQLMEPHVKILHRLLVSNFIQRGVKPSYVQHQDLIVLDKLLKKEQVNLPKLIIQQMDHLKKLTQIGFSRVIKKVLQEHKLYQVLSGVEEQVVREFDPDVFRKMNLVKDPAEGWIRAQVPEPGLGAKSDLKPDEEEDEDLEKPHDEFAEAVDKKVAVLEQNISEVKSDMKEIRAELKEIKDDIKGVQDALMALLERLRSSSVLG